MKKSAKFFAAALFFGAAVSPAVADDFYGAIDIGQTKATDACTGLPAGWTGCKDTATIYRIAGGYQFTPMWGAEVSYGDYGKGDLGSGTVSSFPVTENWKLSGFQFSGTGTFPLGDAFALIGKIGLARSDVTITAAALGNSASVSATSTKLAFGIGAEYSFTKSVAVRAQYENLGTVGDASTTGTAKVSLLSAGVVYKF